MTLTTSPCFNRATILLEELASANAFRVSAATAACPMLLSFPITSAVNPIKATNRASRYIDWVRSNRYMHTSGHTGPGCNCTRRSIAELTLFLSTYGSLSPQFRTYVHTYQRECWGDCTLLETLSQLY